MLKVREGSMLFRSVSNEDIFDLKNQFESLQRKIQFNQKNLKIIEGQIALWEQQKKFINKLNENNNQEDSKIIKRLEKCDHEIKICYQSFEETSKKIQQFEKDIMKIEELIKFTKTQSDFELEKTSNNNAFFTKKGTPDYHQKMDIKEKKQLQDHIKFIATTILQKIKELVPYSSNKSPSEKYPLPNQDEPFHRLFWLTVSNACNDDRDLDVRESVRKWRMDLSKDKIEKGFEYQRINQKFFDCKTDNPTLGEWYHYFSELFTREDKVFHKDKTRFTLAEKIESIAKNAVKFGIGNCYELACLALVLLGEHHCDDLSDTTSMNNILVEMFKTQEGDHAFLVIGRDRQSQFNDINSWGTEVLILDPWMGEVVDVSEQLQNPTSHCFSFIRKYESDLQHYPYSVLIGQGHTDRWLTNRNKKKEPIYLREWKPFYGEEQLENVPWCLEKKFHKT